MARILLFRHRPQVVRLDQRSCLILAGSAHSFLILAPLRRLPQRPEFSNRPSSRPEAGDPSQGAGGGRPPSGSRHGRIESPRPQRRGFGKSPEPQTRGIREDILRPEETKKRPRPAKGGPLEIKRETRRRGRPAAPGIRRGRSGRSAAARSGLVRAWRAPGRRVGRT